jgi:rubrerythrin
MGNLLNVNEVVEFAVYIEQNGYKFYIETMKKFSDERLLKLFQFMADEEFKHEGTFKRLLKDLGSFTPHESYPGEYESYMKDYLKTHALANDVALKEKLDSIKTIDDAINVALDFEKDSIILFTMLKKYIEEPHIKVVDIIIQEEINHIFKIQEFQKGKKL